MRLFRLTSRNADTPFFDATFNDQIEIPPFSQVALQSASVKIIPNELIITEANNNVEFQIRDDIKRNFTLSSNQVYNTNFAKLYVDLAEKINGACARNFTGPTADPTNKILGIEWNVAQNNNNNTVIGYKIGRASSHKDDWQTNELVVGGSTTQTTMINGVDGGASSATNVSNCLIKRSIARGNGYFRARINGIADNGSGNPLDNGMIIGLTRNLDADQTNIQNTDITIGLHASIDANGDPKFYTINGGVFTEVVGTIPIFSADGSSNANNSVMEATINGSNLEINVYNNNASSPTTLLTIPYTGLERLAPLVIFRGGNTGLALNNKLDNIRLTPSPYDLETTLKEESGELEGLGAPPKGNGGTGTDKNQLNFGSFTVARFLGYNNQQIPLNDFIIGKTADFVAENQMTDPQNADSMIVQLLNLSVESFDSFSDTTFASGGQRRNILAVIPATNSTGSIAYEPNERFFLDLNNSTPITLRNIKARIVRNDYSEIPALGLSSMVLLIREKNNM